VNLVVTVSCCNAERLWPMTGGRSRSRRARVLHGSCCTMDGVVDGLLLHGKLLRLWALTRAVLVQRKTTVN